MTYHKAPLLPGWVSYLSLPQQSVLILALRGPDGAAKNHPCKDVQRAYRGSVVVAGRFGRMLEWGEHADSFMSMALIADSQRWSEAVGRFFNEVDSLPHHFYAHLMHGAQILGYKCPHPDLRGRWSQFYRLCVVDLHLRAESEAEMDERLGDWGRKDWPNAETLIRG
jgi:hypothetical protein